MNDYIDGINFDYTKGKNSEENLVFVHGSGCNRKFLRPLARRLRQYNCYLPDLPDHGISDFINCKSADEYVEAIAGFVSKMENVTLIGHSLGGTICLAVAAKNIPSVKKCVIISSGAKFDKLDARIHNMVKNWKVDWLYLIKCLGSLYSPAVLLDFLNFESPQILLKDFAIDIKLDYENVLNQINIPTLITVSKNDILTIPEYSERLHKSIKGSKLHYFSGCRHMLPIVKRRKVAALISDFINN